PRAMVRAWHALWRRVPAGHGRLGASVSSPCRCPAGNPARRSSRNRPKMVGYPSRGIPCRRAGSRDGNVGSRMPLRACLAGCRFPVMRILVCPLDWGLGHAARCVPLIKAHRDIGHDVSVGATGGVMLLLEREFPGLDIFDFPGTRLRYARNPALFLPVMLMQLPGILLGQISEARRLRRI